MDENKLEALRKKLEAVHEWPSKYMFKFIFPADDETYLKVKQVFPEEAVFSSKKSSGGKYQSLTIIEMVMASDTVFARYADVSKIDGVVAL